MANHKAYNYNAKQLEQMINSLEDCQQRLASSGTPHHEKQVLRAAIVSLKSMITDKTRDVRRNLK